MQSKNSSYDVRPEGYLARVVDAKVERFLRIFGAVEIAGTKWCGKTWTALHHAASVSYVDLSLALAKDDPAAMLIGERPHVIDEWQRSPAIWDTVRHAVDRTRGLRGAWILTGSSTPLPKDVDHEGEIPSHSGAGRIGHIRMRPMTLAESGDSTASVSLSGLFRGEFAPSQHAVGSERLVELACRGGWPEVVGMSCDDAQIVAREYLRLIRRESFPRQGKSGDVAQRLLFSLARNLGQAATYETLRADMSDGSGASVSEGTLVSYLELAKGMYLLDEVPGWLPPARSAKRVRTKPKRYLADPSLAVAALGMSPASLLEDWQTFGLVFENLVMRDLMVYAEAMEDAADIPVRYYRDDSGLEADAIVELADGRWAAFEIKTSDVKAHAGLQSLARIEERLCANPKARVRPPEFTAVITGVSKYARQVGEHSYVIPITALTA